MGETMRMVTRGGGAMGLVIGLASAWPAFASTGIAHAPAGAVALIDGLLVFVPLLWAPVPALAVWWAVEGSDSSAVHDDRCCGTDRPGLRNVGAAQ